MIRSSAEPIGSWALVDMFEKRGTRLSPATIGRILNQLDKRGYLERRSYKGRVITAKGERAMERAARLRQISKCGKDLESLLDAKVLRHFIIVLEARRAIERETARLAAANISAEEIEKLGEIDRLREQDYRAGRIDAKNDIQFHRLIAEASRNDVLRVFLHLIHVLRQQSDLFDYMRGKMNKPYFISHDKILQGLRERNAAKAERAMAEHINTLIRDVENYCAEYALPKT
jgi:GntR family transcriptional repressor for pyruvate dehydrogenase complex